MGEIKQVKIPKGKKKERILRVLLNEPQGNLSKYRIAKNAETSFPWVHEFLRQLENEEFIKNTKVIDYSALFNLWKNQRKNVTQRDYVLNDPMTFLSETNFRYALSTYQGENLVQGYLFPSRFDIYILHKDFNRWDESIREQGLLGSGNFRILMDDEHVFYNSMNINEHRIVSIPQLIVDLYKEGGVCGEAADQLVNRLSSGNV